MKQNYGEIICEAVSTIVSKELEKKSYDITRSGIIVDDTYKKFGKYEVLDGSLTYTAYSSFTNLNVNDSVLVLIPGGNLEAQKTILNKITNDDDTNSNHLLPLENMLKFTDDILIDYELNNKSSILANDEEVSSKVLYEFNWKNYIGYERMGVSFKVSTRLNSLNVLKGDYGLKFSFIGNNSTHEMDFGINDMNGNLYHFDTEVEQQKLFDISKLQDIQSLKIEIYQKNNFYDIYNNKVPSTIEGDPILNMPTLKMNDNIFITDIKIYLGYEIGEFKGDTIKLSTNGFLSYNKIDVDSEVNKGAKDLAIRWIHDNEDGTFRIFTEQDIYDKHIEIFWFRYTLNQTENEWKTIAGPNWSPYNFLGGADIFSNSFYPNYEKTEEKIKVIGRIPDNSGNYDYYTSNILTFDNELAIIDTLTYDAATQLSIVCLDNTEGNYFIYDTSSGIINEGQGQGYTRTFEARYNGVLLDDETNGLKNITEIEWLLPVDGIKNTMLSYSDDFLEDAIVSNKGAAKSVKRIIEDDNGKFTQNYSIKNNWNQSNSYNTVECRVTADGIIYKAVLELKFGKAGTSGTNITLVLDYENNKNAIVFDRNINVQDCVVKASMFDTSGEKMTNPSGTWKWDLYNNSTKRYITVEPFQEDNSKVNLTFNKNFGIMIPEDNYTILQATFTPGEGGTPVTAYLPIAFKNIKYGYIEGCRKVIYNSQGVPNYYSDAYSLFDSDNQNEINPQNITWKLRMSNGDKEDIVITWDSSNGVSDTEYKWFNFKNISKNKIFYPALTVSPFYVKGYNDQVCVSAVVNNEVVWSQPILVMQSQYDYATINQWNGSLDINEKENSIMSAMFGAGHKTKDNSFSGIVMGDLKKNTETGLYGLSNGVISFSLVENGVATFGKGPNSGQGYIILGQSDDVNDSVNTITSGNGEMLYDIDKGFISTTYGNGNETLSIGNKDGTSSSYFKFVSGNNKNILDFKKDSYIINSNNDKLTINLNSGLLTFKNGDKTLKIGEVPISVGNFSIDWDGGFGSTLNNVYIGTKPSSDNIINAGNFRVAKDGTVYYKGTELTAYITQLIKQNSNPTA